MSLASPVNGAPQRLTRQVNDRVFCELLAQHGPLSRPQLARLAHLSSPASLKVIERLQEEGLVVAHGYDEQTRPGPKAMLFTLAPNLGLATAVELSGQSIRVRHTPLGSTSPVTHEQVLENDDRLDQAVVGAIRASLPPGDFRRHTVVVALPGAVDPDSGDVLFSTELPRWVQGSAHRITERLPGAQVVFDNEVNFRAIAERQHGVAGDAPDYVLVSLGSGVGAAVVLDGRIHRGRHGAAGEIGFMHTGEPGSTPYQDRAGAWMLAHQVNREHDRDFTWLSETVADEPLGSPVWDAMADQIGPGLINLATVLDPDIIILAGETARRVGEPLRIALQTYLASSLHWRPPTIRASTLGDEAVLLGATDEARATLLRSLFPALY